MLRFQTLGGLDLRGSDGRAIGSVLAQPKRTALLAYLASTPLRFHRRDTLLGVFWPEADPLHARDSLRQAVRYLRRSLGDDVVIGRGGEELGIDGARLWCDAVAFEETLAAGQPARALELYRGDLLEGFFLADAAGFERWLEEERARLRSRAVEAARAVTEQQEAAGDPDGAVRAARRALALSPADERSLRGLLSLLDRLGDRAGAVLAYDEFAARLATELGVAPSAETTELGRTLRTIRNDAPEQAGVDRDPSTPAHAVVAPAGRESEPTGLAPEPAPSATPDIGAHTTSHSNAPRRFARLVGLAAVLLLTLAGARFVLSGRDSVAADAGRVVILPLENRTGEDALDPLGRWAADWITQALTRTGDIRVIDGATGVPGSAGASLSDKELRALLERTGAGVVLSGAYYRFGDSIEFQVRITDNAGRSALRALEPVRGSVAEPQLAIHTMGERVTGAFAAHRHPWIQALNADGSRPPSLEAYLAWTDGLVLFGRKDFRAAGVHLLHAASLDTSFVTPLLWAAAAHANVRDYTAADSLLRIANGRRSQLLPFDRHLLDMWLAISRGDRMAHYYATARMLEVAPASELGLFLAANAARAINRPGEAVAYARQIDVAQSAVDWDAYGTGLTDAWHLLEEHDLELQESRRVRQRRPDLLRAHQDEIRARAALGDGAEVLRQLDRIMALAPQPGITPASVAHVAADELRVHGDPAAADAALRMGLEWYRTRSPAEQATDGHRYGAAQLLHRAGRWDEAAALLRELSAKSPGDVRYLGHLGVIAAHTGQTAEAERIAAVLNGMSAPFLWGSNVVWAARIAAALGRHAEALALLRAAFARGEPWHMNIHADPFLAPLRDEPGFRELMQPRR